MFKLTRTLVYIVVTVVYAYGQTSENNVKNSDASSTAQAKVEDKSNIKIGSSGFSEFKGNIPIDKSYRSYVSSVNVGSLGGALRSSSVLREAQLHSAASRAEMYYTGTKGVIRPFLPLRSCTITFGNV